MRRVILLGSGAALALILAATVIAAVQNQGSLAAMTVVLSAATVAVAVLAALVALLAYAAATGPPDLDVKIRFPFSEINKPSFRTDPADTWRIPLSNFKQLWPTIVILNKSRWSARNPAVRIELVGLAGIEEQKDWPVIQFVSSVGATAVQWDGGTAFSIHGRSERVLPPLSFASVFAVKALHEHALVVDVLAEGFRKRLRLPVTLLPPVTGKALA